MRARPSLGEIGCTVLVRVDEDGAAATAEVLASGAALNRDAAKAGLSVIVVTQGFLGDDSGLVGAAGWNAATGVSR